MTKPRRFEKLEMAPLPPREMGRGGFITLTRQRMRSRFADGSASDWYTVDTAWPPFKDAVVLCLYDPHGPRVVLRRGVRPAVALRSADPALKARDGREFSGALWELPAGGIEPEDLLPEGMGSKGRAMAEAWEECGVRIAEASIQELGVAPFTAPSFCPERLVFVAARPESTELAAQPPGDGHPLEQGAEVRWVSLAEALDWCARGAIIDIKTELGLRRLADFLGQPHDGSQGE